MPQNRDERPLDAAALFRPRAVMLVGASHDPQKPGGAILRHLTETNPQFAIYAVNPHRLDAPGCHWSPSIDAVPEQCELAIVAVPAAKVPAAAKPAAPKAAAKPTPKPAPVVAQAKPVPPAPVPVETPAAILPEAAAPVAAMIETAVEAAETVTETVKAETPTAAADPAPVTPKEVKTMEATIKSMTDKTQAAFADFNTRAKAAVEKSTKMFEDANEFGKGNVEALVESSKIAAKGAETLGQDAAAFAKKSFEDATAAMKSFASVKSPTDFFKLQSDYVRGAFDAMVAESAKSTEAMLKLAGEVAQPISNRFAVAAEKVKIAA